MKSTVVRVGQHPNNQLSNEAIEAKKCCRRMERLYRSKGTGAAKQAYKSAKEAAKLAILNSKASSIKEELNSNANPRSMWRSLNRILHSRPQQHYSDAECQSLVTSFNTFFISKIANIHQSIANTLASSSTSSFPPRQFSGATLSTLPPVLPTEVLKAISALPNKTSPLDPLPTSILKKYSPILSPILSKLANLSFSTGVFPSTFKSAQVLPLLKKPSLDPSSLANYRPISNLSTMSKLLERLILPRIRPHITNSLISLPCNLPIDLVSPQKPPSLISLTIFPTYVEIVTAPSWSALTYRRPLTLLTTEYCWIDSTLILVLTVLPSRGFAPTFPTDLNTLRLAITLPPPLLSLPGSLRALS